jgi:hypothetical protein
MNNKKRILMIFKKKIFTLIKIKNNFMKHNYKNNGKFNKNKLIQGDYLFKSQMKFKLKKKMIKINLNNFYYIKIKIIYRKNKVLLNIKIQKNKIKIYLMIKNNKKM